MPEPVPSPRTQRTGGAIGSFRPNACRDRIPIAPVRGTHSANTLHVLALSMAEPEPTACRSSAVEIAHPFGLPDHQLDGRHLDRRRWPDRLCADRDAEHEAGAGRRAELPGVARRKPLQLPRRHHRRRI